MEKEETIQIGPRIPKSLKKELDLICVREGSDVQDIVKKCLEDYVKEHGEGNPAYALTKWIEEPKFKAYPALMDPSRNWLDYFSNCNREEAEEIYHKCTGIRENARNYF